MTNSPDDAVGVEFPFTAPLPDVFSATKKELAAMEKLGNELIAGSLAGQSVEQD